jgi:predicted acylesterase/phospholipase RssA
VLDNLPVETMWRTAEGPIVAVDVTGRPVPPRESARSRKERLSRPVRRLLAGSPAPLPRLGDTLMRTLTVGSSDTTAAARRHADLIVEPRVEGVGMLEWERLDSMRALGLEAARAALAEAPDALRP